jgi:hypothetical protein
VILLSFDVALGGLEVTPYEFVRKTEERLVLFYRSAGATDMYIFEGMGKYEEKMAVSVELDSRELCCHDGRRKRRCTQKNANN